MSAGWVTATGNFSRQANTTQYAVGNLVANSATANAVVPITVAPSPAPGTRAYWLRKCVLTHSKATVTASSFRVWFLTTSPTVTNGDLGAIAGVALSTIIAVVDVDVDTLMTGSGAWGASFFDPGLIRLPQTCYALIEATDTYTPASGETFTLTVEGEACP